jgi:hypothetical protein
VNELSWAAAAAAARARARRFARALARRELKPDRPRNRTVGQQNRS